MKTRACSIVIFIAALLAKTPDLKAEIEFVESDDKIVVTSGGKAFTRILTKGHARPILHPLLTSSGSRLNREFPFSDDVAGESKDHPHHQSLWFGHGDVNGVDFWKTGEGKGTIEVRETFIEADSVTLKNVWKDPQEKPLLHDSTTLQFGEDGTLRWIDYTVKLTARSTAVTFGDTKEGTMAVRTHPALRTKPPAKGKAINSEGETGGDLWGKRATWVAYSGEPGAIAILDHPDNLRYPSTWHARDYGLVAANPFGIHDFEKKPKGSGDFTLDAGKSLQFCYRFLFSDTELSAEEIEMHHERWKYKKNG